MDTETDQQPTTGEKPKRAPKPTPRQLLVEFVTKDSNMQIWHDTDGVSWVSTTDGRHMQVAGREFRDWMLAALYDATKSVPTRQDLDAAIATLVAIARRTSQAFPVFLRVGEDDDGVLWIDMCDPARQAIRVTGSRWAICAADVVIAKFRRPKGMLPLPTPKVPAASALEEWRRFFNVASDDDMRLLLTWMSAALRPTGPYPVLAISGEQGSAKSTLTKMVRALIDPNTKPDRGKLKDERSLVAAIWNNHVVAFDNLSGLSEDMADTLCRLATEGSFGGRKLYTDDEEAVFSAERPVILNGIPELTTRGDLADRALALHLPRVEHRRDESGLWAEFDRRSPHLLAGLLDVLQAGLAALPRVATKRELPRMADFARWGMAVAPALGWTADAFLDAFARSQADARQTILEDDPVVSNILALAAAAKRNPFFEGNATTLLAAITRGAWDHRNVPWSMQRPENLGRHLKRVAPILRGAGVEVEFRRTKAERLIVLTRLGVTVTEDDGHAAL